MLLGTIKTNEKISSCSGDLQPKGDKTKPFAKNFEEEDKTLVFTWP